MHSWWVLNVTVNCTLLRAAAVDKSCTRSFRLRSTTLNNRELAVYIVTGCVPTLVFPESDDDSAPRLIYLYARTVRRWIRSHPSDRRARKSRVIWTRVRHSHAFYRQPKKLSRTRPKTRRKRIYWLTHV